MTMTPEKLELLRKWIQNECRYIHYKLSAEDSIDEISDSDIERYDGFQEWAEWNDVCKQSADAAFFQVVMAFCGTD